MINEQILNLNFSEKIRDRPVQW